MLTTHVQSKRVSFSQLAVYVGNLRFPCRRRRSRRRRSQWKNRVRLCACILSLLLVVLSHCIHDPRKEAD